MLLVVMLFGMAAALFVFGIVDTTALVLRRDQDTAAAFANVKQALIGWSVQRTSSNALPNARPGELPCPDINPLDGYEDGSCAAGAIGRVPWKTLGIPEPKDSAGETLWYAIAGPFRIWSMSGTVINSDTKGNLTIYQNSTATAITTEAIAVVFAPGASLGTQNRDTAATAFCPTTGTTIALNLCAANYLETAAFVNNATPTANPPLAPAPSFISAPNSDTFNDKVMVITTADLMPVVEQRVARELRTVLQSYKAAVGAYPWADCTDGGSDFGSNRGRIPWQTALPVNWGSGGAPQLPGWVDPTNRGWFVNNSWSWVIYYSAGKNYLEGSGASCSSCVNPTFLTVDGVSNKEVVLLTTAPAGASRPIGTPGDCQPTVYWPYYLEDPQNNDVSDDIYVTPSSTAYARDRIYTIP